MVNVAVLGSNEFVVGFQLAGVREVVEVGDHPLDDIKRIRENSVVGIVIIDQAVLDTLDEENRIDIEDSVVPVFIPVSTTAEQDSLKRLIKKSIGVDLWS